MNRFIPILFIFVLSSIGCQSRRHTVNNNTQPTEVSPMTQPSSAPTQEQPATEMTSSVSEEKELYFISIFTEDEAVYYQQYRAEIQRKMIVDRDYFPKPFEVSYAIVKRGNQTLGTFEGVYFGLGNATEIGLFDFLGDQTKQLAISQTVPRGGRHWIVRLSPSYKVLFDSRNYEVGREEVGIKDYDKDGVYEIGLAATSFYLVFDFSMSETPLPWVIFKYNRKTEQYLPANHLYQQQLLSGIDEGIKGLPMNPKTDGYLSSRLDILLDYLYAGEEKKGWEFFDKAYNQPDKKEVVRKVRRVLNQNRAYKYIKAQALRMTKG